MKKGIINLQKAESELQRAFSEELVGLLRVDCQRMERMDEELEEGGVHRLDFLTLVCVSRPLKIARHVTAESSQLSSVKTGEAST